MTTEYTVVQLDTLSLSQLVTLYNSDAEKPVKAFKTKPVALERCERQAAGRAVIVWHGAPVSSFETVAQRETRLAGLSENEAAERDAQHDDDLPSFDECDDSGAQPHAVAAMPPANDVVPTTKRRGPAPSFADDHVVTVLVPVATARRSPKAANWARYALYRDGMTVGEYLAACVALQGGTATRWRGDLIWDVAREFISVAARS